MRIQKPVSAAAKARPGSTVIVHEGDYAPIELGPDCSGSEEDMINEISGNVCAGIEDEESWSEQYGKVYPDRADIADGFRSLIDDVGSGFIPDEDMIRRVTLK